MFALLFSKFLNLIWIKMCKIKCKKPSKELFYRADSVMNVTLLEYAFINQLIWKLNYINILIKFH